MKNWLKTNWFQIVVILILFLIYLRLGEIKENTFYTADMVDSSTTRVINSLSDSLRSIDSGIDSIRRNQ